MVVLVLTVLGAICALILVAPTIPDDATTVNTRLPAYLHMTTNSKVIASYILGEHRTRHACPPSPSLPFRSANCGFYSTIITRVGLHNCRPFHWRACANSPLSSSSSFYSIIHASLSSNDNCIFWSSVTQTTMRCIMHIACHRWQGLARVTARKAFLDTIRYARTQNLRDQGVRIKSALRRRRFSSGREITYAMGYSATFAVTSPDVRKQDKRDIIVFVPRHYQVLIT